MTNPNKLADALAARDAAIQQAQIWKMEAQSANATIAEIYRLVGSKAGNWNGAKPVREALAEHDAQPAPGEWVMVPKVPTEAMIEAAEIREDDEPLSDWGKTVRAPHEAIYAAMLAVAPQPAPAPVHPCTLEVGCEEANVCLASMNGKPEQCGAHPPAPAADGAGELPPIEHDEAYERDYIPLPGGWEVQTKGKGSTFRLCDTKTGERMPVVETMLHPWLERMAREVRVAIAALRQPDVDARIFALEHAAAGARALIGVMFGRADGSMPATVDTPIGVPVKIGEIYRDLESALASQQESRK